MPKYATGTAPTLEAQLPEGSLARRAVAGLKKAGSWLGLDQDASVETSMMGPVGPAITMVTKKPLTELLRRLAPTDSLGMKLDPQQFPNITDAAQQVVETYPRVMSHAQSIMADLPTGGRRLGEINIPNRIAKWAQGQGTGAGDLYRRTQGDPIAKIRVNPDVESMAGRPLETLTHEANHLAGFIMDPRTYIDTSDAMQRAYRSNFRQQGRSLTDSGSLAYHLDPAEVSSRIAGFRNAGGLKGPLTTRPSVAEAFEAVMPHPAMGPGTQLPTADTLQNLWKLIRTDLRSRMP